MLRGAAYDLHLYIGLMIAFPSHILFRFSINHYNKFKTFRQSNILSNRYRQILPFYD